jgi:hypothetical protein
LKEGKPNRYFEIYALFLIANLSIANLAYPFQQCIRTNIKEGEDSIAETGCNKRIVDRNEVALAF